MTIVAHADSGELVSFLLLAGLGTLLATRTWSRRHGPPLDRWLPLVFGGGLIFQVLHTAEHVLQLGYWMAHPTTAPWLTPWAAAGRDLLATATDGRVPTGAELLHLVGNAVFFVALVAGAMLARVQEVRRDHRGHQWLRRALWLQGYHVAEHVALTTSWLLLGTPVGSTTLFGLLQPGTVAGNATRVWVHFAINAVATWWAFRAGAELLAGDRSNVQGPDPEPAEAAESDERPVPVPAGA